MCWVVKLGERLKSKSMLFKMITPFMYASKDIRNIIQFNYELYGHLSLATDSSLRALIMPTSFLKNIHPNLKVFVCKITD